MVRAGLRRSTASGGPHPRASRDTARSCVVVTSRVHRTPAIDAGLPSSVPVIGAGVWREDAPTDHSAGTSRPSVAAPVVRLGRTSLPCVAVSCGSRSVRARPGDGATSSPRRYAARAPPASPAPPQGFLCALRFALPDAASAPSVSVDDSMTGTRRAFVRNVQFIHERRGSIVPPGACAEDGRLGMDVDGPANRRAASCGKAVEARRACR
jgi:hypothetical protein